MSELCDRFNVTMEVVIRQAVADDLPNLEWFGVFTAHREIILTTFLNQQKGQSLMLIADANGFPVGQVWLDFEKHKAERVGVLWAVRVVPWLRNLGIGTRLIHAAEKLLTERGYAWAELGVEIENEAAKRLYERLGYIQTQRLAEKLNYTTPDGLPVTLWVDQWILRKPLTPPK